MARKDVDLVIRAREEGKNVITSITKALEQFVGNQDDLQKSAAQTDSALNRLGSSLTGLNKALDGVGANSKVSAELDKARASTERLSKATAEATGEAIGYARESRQAARATQTLRVESERVAAAIEQQRRAVSTARDAQDQLNRTTKAAGQERKRLAEGEAKLSNEIEKQRLKLTLAKTAYRDLQAEISNTVGPTARLEKSLSGIGRAVRVAEEKLDELRSTQSVVRNSIDATSRSVERANDLYGRQASTLTAQTSVLSRLEAKQKEIGQTVRASATNQSKLETASRKAANGLTSQISALERAESGYRELQAVANETEGALAGLESRVRGPLLKAFGQQAEKVTGLRQEYERTAIEATQLGRALARADDPSNELVASFEAQRAAAARARLAFREQQTELGRLRQVLRETGGDVTDFASRQQRVQTILDRAGQSYRAYAAESQQAATAVSRAAREAARAEAAQNRLASATTRSGVAAARAARETRTLAGAIRQFYGESRQALSFTQRLRGEVLSLVAAYGGFFAIIEGVRGVVNAYQELEGAQSRLNAVFDGDQQAVAAELDFIRRNAERLGVEFGTLAGEYTKFAVATKNTNLEGAETRRIFIAVAEAARVNKATNDQLRGTFVALTQIVNKGSVSMEELRQQLGDRLPGAIQIMADAAGVGTKELIKMIEQGELGSDILSKFADELDNRFSDALPAALKTTTAEIGRFQNALFQASLRIANGGFIEAFNDLLSDLTTTLQSGQFESFLDRLSVALSAAANTVAFLARNFDILVIAITAFIGLKLAPFLILLASRMGILTGATVSTTRGFRALAVAVNTGAVSMSRAQIAIRGLTIALRGLLSSTGIGLAVVAIGAAIGAWSTSTEDATETMNRHQKIVDQVKSAYDKVGESVSKVREEIESITLTEARASARKLREELQRIRSLPTGVASISSDPEIQRAAKNLNDLIEAFKDGRISAVEFKDAVDDIAETDSNLNRNIAEQLIETAKAAENAELSLRQAEDVIIVLTGTTEEAQAALDRLANKARESGNAADDAADKTEQWDAALDKLKKLVPSITEDLKELDEKAKLKSALDAALQLAQTYGQVTQAVRLYDQALSEIEGRAALKLFEGASGAVGSAAALIRSREGFRSQAYNDPRTDRNGNQVGPDIFRAGFGSDTITLADGSIRKITEGMRVSREDANRDLVRRIGEFQQGIRGQVGDARFESFSAQQQAVLTSIAYNYGELPGRILDAVRNGTSAEISTAIRTLGGDNGGVNRGRRNQEATIFAAAPDATGAGDQFMVKQAEERAKLAEKLAEERERANAATTRAIADGSFEIEQQQLILAGKAREAAINDAIRAAKQENTNITDRQLAQIREQAGALFDLEQQEKNLLTAKEAAEKAESRVNDLLLLRKQLQTELAIQLAEGAGPEVLTGLRDQMSEVNSQIQEAIDNAIKLFEALGSSDPAVQAVISKLRELKVTSAEVSGQVKIEWEDIEKVLASSLVNAANRFAQSLSEGKSVTESLGDAFRQFAADFLRQIAQMIIQQIALNTAKAIGRALGFGVAHQGGVIGAQGAKRKLNVGSVMRYHTGGVAGLAPNEVPTILERGEEVLTRDDPRHIFNQGKKGSGGAGQAPRVKVVNAFSAEEVMSEALNTRDGEEAFLNFVRSNSATVRAALED